MISTKSLQVLVLSVAAVLVAMPAAASASKAETFRNGKSWYGVPNSAEAATRVIDVKSAKEINVDCGETITFKNGDKKFTWRFDVAGHHNVDLRKIAPAGFTSEKLMVYVSANVFERN